MRQVVYFELDGLLWYEPWYFFPSDDLDLLHIDYTILDWRT